MSITVYIETDKPELLAVHEGVMSSYQAWAKELAELSESWGFFMCRCSDFGVSPEFLLKREEGDKSRKGPEIEGFKGGSLIGLEEGACFIYSLNRRKAGNEKRAMLENLRKKHRPEGMEHHVFGGKEGFICKLLGLSMELFTGNSIRYSSCYKLDGKLIVTMPAGNSSDGMVIPIAPEGWTEITAGDFLSRVKAHNDRINQKSEAAK